MLETLSGGGQPEARCPAPLVYGQSVTDACMDIEMTASALDTLAPAVQVRRGTASE